MMNYQRAGVASTFSPTFSAVLAEAGSFSSHFHAALEVIHAAAYDPEKEKRFQHELGSNAEIRWVEGETPAKAILHAAQMYDYQLLIAGALKSEDDDRLFTSGVARSLLRHAPCDLLLVPRPIVEPAAPEHIVFAFDPGEDCAGFLQRVAEAFQPKRMTVTVTNTPFAAAIAASRGEKPHDLDSWLDESVAAFHDSPIEVATQVVTSNTGYNLCDVIQGLEADLLVVKARNGHAGNPLPVHMDWLYQVIPTRLLVVRD